MRSVCRATGREKRTVSHLPRVIPIPLHANNLLLGQPSCVLEGLLDVGRLQFGVTGQISWLVAPFATWPTITETGIRMPRMHARPPMICGSNVIRSNGIMMHPLPVLLTGVYIIWFDCQTNWLLFLVP